MKFNEKVPPIVKKSPEGIFSVDDLKRKLKTVKPYLVPVLTSILASCDIDKNNTRENQMNTFVFESENMFEENPRKKKESVDFPEALLTQTEEEFINIESFLDDPAIKIAKDLGYDVLVPKSFGGTNMSEVETTEWIMRVCRGMYVAGAESTEENFKLVLSNIVETINNPEIRNQELFTGRNVAVFANNETLPDSLQEKYGTDERFAPVGMIDAIQDQAPFDVSLFKPENNIQSINENYQKFTDYVVSRENLTVFFDAHGENNGYIYFQGEMPDGAMTKEDRATFEHTAHLYHVGLAYLLEERYVSNEIKDTPIFIFNSCFAHDFARDLYPEIMAINEKKGIEIPLPIIITSAEYGQVGLSDLGNKYGSEFAEVVFSKKNVKIEDILNIEFKRKTPTNISVFAPFQTEEGKRTYLQIAENNKAQKEAERLFVDALSDGMINEKHVSLFEIDQPAKAARIRRQRGEGNDKT